MPQFLNGPKLSKRIAQALKENKSAKFAVAFWGKGAAETLGIDKKSAPGIRIVCNLLSGGTNPAEIRSLLDLGAGVKQLNDLHAKIGIVGKLSFLGSSNMSTNGLGDSEMQPGLREMNIVYDRARPEIVKAFKAYWADASDITEDDLVRAQHAWDIRQKASAKASASGRSLAEVIRDTPQILDDLNVRMVVYDTVTDEDDLGFLRKANDEAERKYGECFDVYWNWDSIQTDAENGFLVDYDWPATGPIARGQLRRRNTSFPDFKIGDERLHPAYEIDTIEGISFGAKDRDLIKKAFHRYVKDGHSGEDEDQRSYNFLISELRPYLPSM